MTANFESCENCGKPRLQSERLSVVDSWVISQLDGRRRPSYWLVCSACYSTRQQWCSDVFPDVCEKCGASIPDGEHYLDNDNVSHGLLPGETCYIVCEACYRERPA